MRKHETDPNVCMYCLEEGIEFVDGEFQENRYLATMWCPSCDKRFIDVYELVRREGYDYGDGEKTVHVI